MKPIIKVGTQELNWIEVLKLLDNKKEIIRSEKSIKACQKVQTAFENSYIVISIWVDKKMVGICRALSDGIRQSIIYDLNVSVGYQNNGLGQKLIEALIKELPNGPIVLYASPGKENYYKRFGFQKLLTGMALFPDQENRVVQGFIK
jgi:ribosomal protein S18 acetylase RimI-like enzyme